MLKVVITEPGEPMAPRELSVLSSNWLAGRKQGPERIERQEKVFLAPLTGCSLHGDVVLRAGCEMMG